MNTPINDALDVLIDVRKLKNDARMLSSRIESKPNDNTLLDLTLIAIAGNLNMIEDLLQSAEQQLIEDL